MPIGYGVRNNYIEEKATLEETVTAHFSAGQCAAPVLCGLCSDSQTNGQCDQDPYSGYVGALRCLSYVSLSFLSVDLSVIYCGR